MKTTLCAGVLSLALIAPAPSAFAKHHYHKYSQTRGAVIGGVAGALVGGTKGALIGAGLGAGVQYERNQQYNHTHHRRVVHRRRHRR